MQRPAATRPRAGEIRLIAAPTFAMRSEELSNSPRTATIPAGSSVEWLRAADDPELVQVGWARTVWVVERAAWDMARPVKSSP